MIPEVFCPNLHLTSTFSQSQILLAVHSKDKTAHTHISMAPTQNTHAHTEIHAYTWNTSWMFVKGSLEDTSELRRVYRDVMSIRKWNQWDVMSIRKWNQWDVVSIRKWNQRDGMSIGGVMAELACFTTQTMWLKVRWRAKCGVLQ